MVSDSQRSRGMGRWVWRGALALTLIGAVMLTRQQTPSQTEAEPTTRALSAFNQEFLPEVTTTIVPTTTTASVVTTVPPTTTTTVAPTTTTSQAPPPVAVAPSSERNWDAVAQCESGGNWHINTGNGYYGGLQFDLQTWRSVGGTGYPHEHSREVQIHHAEVLYSQRGAQPWPHCGKYL